MSKNECLRANEDRVKNFIWITVLLGLCLISIYLAYSLVKIFIVYRSADSNTIASARWLELVFHRATWLALALATCVLAWLRRWPSIVIGLICLFVLEAGSLKLHARLTGGSFTPFPPSMASRFIPHPLLQAIPNPGVYGEYSHSEANARLTINVDKVSKPLLVVAYGGSTTYGSGVSDAETWSSVLSARLGSGYLVENRGVPGYTTVENIIQAAFDFRKVQPVCAIYYVGWNDLRNSNLTNLKPDYSDFHLINQQGLTTSTGWLQRRSAFASLLSNAATKKSDVAGRVENEYDKRVSKIYRQNIMIVATIDRLFHVKPIFIPQILNYKRLTEKSPYGWLPYVNDEDIKKLMGFMNADLAATAEETNSVFLDEPLRIDWTDTDFVDNGHFSRQGNEKFAASIARRISEECR